MTPSPTSRRLLRLLCVITVVLLAGAVLTPASANLSQKQQEQKLKEYQHALALAQEKANTLGHDISRTQFDLQQLRAKVAGLEGEVLLAQKEYQIREDDVKATVEKQTEVKGQLDTTNEGMDARIRTAFKQGPSGTLDLLLGASSVADLSEREAFLNALQAQDANTAATLDNLGDDLRQLSHEQKQKAHEAQKALKYLQGQQFALQEARDTAATKLADLTKQEHEAHALEVQWEHKVKIQTTKVGYYVGGPGPFYACPVPNYSWIADDFGAIRYTTSPPHYHAGNDIGGAAGADIVAPFDGIAKKTYNSLGGNSVYVYGKEGYVYNAHLSAWEGALPRHVDAGEVIGHVGMTGDAQGGVNHDHFEWHPNDPNGARTINGAVDPNPSLGEVCHK